MDDYKVSPRSAKDIEALTLAWRDALGIQNVWAPDMVRLLENELPKLPKYFSTYSLAVRPTAEMGDAEAYTEFDPPHIVVSNVVYQEARKQQGRARMTLAHELGHLVMHPGAAKFRAEFAAAPTKLPFYESAEWQANKFASLFLMPTHIVREFNSLPQLVDCCKVSHAAARIRFDEVIRPNKALPNCVLDVINRQ